LQVDETILEKGMAQDPKAIVAETKTYLQLFEERAIYRVPIFQRPFVWSKTKVMLLFKDVIEIENVIPDEAHFVGSMFVSQRVSGTTDMPAEFWVIDGQQRTTTIYLSLLALFTEVSSEVSKQLRMREKDEAAYSRLTSFQNTVKRYIFVQLDSGALVPKLTSTCKDSRQVRALFCDCGLADVSSIQLPPDEGDTGETEITQAFKVLRQAVRKNITEKGLFSRDLANVLLNKILQCTRVVLITLTDKEDAGSVFNTLNSTAEPLSSLDLVRNAVFSRVEGEDKNFTGALALYVSEWQPLEMRFDDKDHFNDFLFPYALANIPKAQKKRLMPYLISNWVKPGDAAGSKIDFTGLEVIADLKRYASTYLSLNGKRLEIDAMGPILGVELHRAMWRLRRMNVSSQVFPYVFKLIDHAIRGTDDTKANAAKCLGVIESFLVRRFFRGAEPTGLHAVFKGLWFDCGDNLQRLSSCLKDVKTMEFPADDVFVSDLASYVLSGSSMEIYVLMERERHMGESQGLLILESFETENDVGTRRITDAAGTWSNILLVLNDEIGKDSDGDWSKLRPLIERSTAFKSTNAMSSLPAVWDKGCADARFADIKEWALGRWKS
jgi:hypothetical protein